MDSWVTDSIVEAVATNLPAAARVVARLGAGGHDEAGRGGVGDGGGDTNVYWRRQRIWQRRRPPPHGQRVRTRPIWDPRGHQGAPAPW